MQSVEPERASATRTHQEERIDEALDESFPASDPPYFSLGVKAPAEPPPPPAEKRTAAPMVEPRRYAFGATAAIVTSVSLIVGLAAASASRTAIVTGLLIIALADNITDSLSVHMYQESEKLESTAAFRVTLTNFGARLFVASSFVALVLTLSIPAASIVAVTWGAVLLSLVTYDVARTRGLSPAREIAKHLAVATLVIAVGRTIGWLLAPGAA